MIFARSDRLLLRRARPDDVAALRPGWSEPAMTRYTTPRDDPEAFLVQLVADMNAKQPSESEPGGPWYQYVVERAADGAVVGDLGCGFGVPGEAQVELGYRILPAFQGQGYATEAVAVLIDHLIAQHGIHRFVAVACFANAPSCDVLRRLGFRQEGHFVKSFRCDGEWIDDGYFALLAEEWRARPRRLSGAL